MALYFLNRLNQIKLATCPSDFYRIKPSIFLTMLSLIVTYILFYCKLMITPQKVQLCKKQLQLHLKSSLYFKRL